MLSALVATFGLRRRPSLRQAFAQAREIDKLAEELEELDSPPESKAASPATPRRRKKVP